MSVLIRVEATLEPGARTQVWFPPNNIRGEIVACVVRSCGARNDLVYVTHMQAGTIALLLEGFGEDGIAADELAELPISLPVDPALRVGLVLKPLGESTMMIRATIAITPRVDPPRPVPYAPGMIPQPGQIPGPWGSR